MRTVPLWLSYVDDTFTFVPLQTQTKSTIFTNTLDRRRTYSYQGIEENGKIPFLDCLVTLDNNRLRTTIYRKPTHQQVTGPVIIQLCRLSQLYGLHGLWPDERLQLVCNLPGSLQDETDSLNIVFSKNNYNADLVRRNTRSNADFSTQHTNVNSGPVTTAIMAYIRSTCETIARTIQQYNTRVAHKTITTLRRLLTNSYQGQRQAETDREQYITPHAATSRPLTVVKPAETLARNWLNTNKRQEISWLRQQLQLKQKRHAGDRGRR